jgi:hypothetical protein
MCFASTFCSLKISSSLQLAVILPREFHWVDQAKLFDLVECRLIDQMPQDFVGTWDSRDTWFAGGRSCRVCPSWPMT